MKRISVSQEEMKGLVERVAAELKRRLKEDGHPQTFAGISPGRGARNAKKRLLVIGTLEEEERKTLSDSYELVRQEEFCTKDWEEAHAQDYELILVASLSPKAMAQVAHGISAGGAAAGILQGLMMGRPVFLLERGLEYRNYKDSASRTLYLFYQKQEEVMKHFGIRFVEHTMDILDQAKRKTGGEMQRLADLTHLTLLQESDLIRARNMGCRGIRLKEGAKVTPLAMDYRNSHGLTFFWE
ncbi:MAG: hypothetical protein HFI76_03140 [Lachnospiraceae bacterium]|nr:hypothetical protein [Lachnospiraceae bacterium]